MSAALERMNGGGPEIYRAPVLEKLGFIAFFTGRGGGVSQAPFDSLNVSLSVGDSAINVRENLERIRKAMGIGELWRARQAHGDHVAGIAHWPPARMEDADALVVAIPRITAAVSVADCLPVILADPAKKVAAAVHAGRKSTELHISRKTALRMTAWFDCVPRDIVAVFGPCIRQCCYQVDDATAAKFGASCGGSGRMLDIARANREQLLSIGVRDENIHDSGLCTSCGKDRFFSHRGHGGSTGRFLCGVTIL
jgi:hypothetical protein